MTSVHQTTLALKQRHLICYSPALEIMDTTMQDMDFFFFWGGDSQKLTLLQEESRLYLDLR